MATVQTQIRIDSTVKQQVTELFDSLGLDMSGAVNLFLHQCLYHDGLPFAVERPRLSKETLDTIAEAKRIAKDPNVTGYNSFESLKAALESDDE